MRVHWQHLSRSSRGPSNLCTVFAGVLQGLWWLNRDRGLSHLSVHLYLPIPTYTYLTDFGCYQSLNFWRELPKRQKGCLHCSSIGRTCRDTLPTVLLLICFDGTRKNITIVDALLQAVRPSPIFWNQFQGSSCDRDTIWCNAMQCWKGIKSGHLGAGPMMICASCKVPGKRCSRMIWLVKVATQTQRSMSCTQTIVRKPPHVRCWISFRIAHTEELSNILLNACNVRKCSVSKYRIYSHVVKWIYCVDMCHGWSTRRLW